MRKSWPSKRGDTKSAKWKVNLNLLVNALNKYSSKAWTTPRCSTESCSHWPASPNSSINTNFQAWSYMTSFTWNMAFLKTSWTSGLNGTRSRTTWNANRSTNGFTRVKQQTCWPKPIRTRAFWKIKAWRTGLQARTRPFTGKNSYNDLMNRRKGTCSNERS